MQFHIHNDHRVCMMLFFGVFSLCTALYTLSSTLIANMFVGYFGIFTNLTLISYFLTIGLTIKILFKSRAEVKSGKRKVFLNIGIIALAVVMAGEQIDWMIPLWADNIQQDTVMNIQDAVIASFRAVPEKASLEWALVIGSLRFIMIFGMLYLLGFIVFYKQKLLGALENPDNADMVFYGVGFFILLVFSMALRAAGGSLEVFESGTDVTQSICILFYTMTKTQASRAGGPEVVSREK